MLEELLKNHLIAEIILDNFSRLNDLLNLRSTSRSIKCLTDDHFLLRKEKRKKIKQLKISHRFLAMNQQFHLAFLPYNNNHNNNNNNNSIFDSNQKVDQIYCRSDEIFMKNSKSGQISHFEVNKGLRAAFKVEKADMWDFDLTFDDGDDKVNIEYAFQFNFDDFHEPAPAAQFVRNGNGSGFDKDKSLVGMRNCDTFVIDHFNAENDEITSFGFSFDPHDLIYSKYPSLYKCQAGGIHQHPNLVQTYSQFKFLGKFPGRGQLFLQWTRLKWPQ